MSRKLSALDVDRFTHPGGNKSAFFVVDEALGLYLKITPKGRRSWLLRVMYFSKLTDFGLGPVPTMTLAQARKAALEKLSNLDRLSYIKIELLGYGAELGVGTVDRRIAEYLIDKKIFRSSGGGQRGYPA